MWYDQPVLNTVKAYFKKHWLFDQKIKKYLF